MRKKSNNGHSKPDAIDLERMKTLVSDASGQSEYAVDRGGVAFTPTKADCTWQIIEEEL